MPPAALPGEGADPLGIRFRDHGQVDRLGEAESTPARCLQRSPLITHARGGDPALEDQRHQPPLPDRDRNRGEGDREAPGELFDYFIPIPLSRILLGYGPIPAVILWRRFMQVGMRAFSEVAETEVPGGRVNASA
jgi:hypothetical protein